MRVVIDTNVVISRYLSSQGAPAQIFTHWQKKKFDLLVSEPILEEYERALQYPHVRLRHQLSDAEIAEIIEEFTDLAKIVKPKKSIAVVTADPDDDKFIECAVEGRATYIVSGNRHLSDLIEYNGIQILKSAQFLIVLEQEIYKKAA